jgi:hypothetical protein
MTVGDPHARRLPLWLAGRRAAVIAAVCVVLLAGCGITDPYSASTTTGRSATRAAVTVPREDHDGPPAPTAPRPASGAGQASPSVALARYGRLYVNWSWQTVAANQRRLASISVGQAHAQALAAAQPEPTLARYAVHNHGQVVAIAPGEGTERGKWAVVTDEQTSGDGPYEGLPATSHVTWATVQRTGQGWAVSGWYPGS